LILTQMNLINVHAVRVEDGNVGIPCMSGAPRTKKTIGEGVLELQIGNSRCLNSVIHATSISQKQIALGVLLMDSSAPHQVLTGYLQVIRALPTKMANTVKNII